MAEMTPIAWTICETFMSPDGRISGLPGLHGFFGEAWVARDALESHAMRLEACGGRPVERLYADGPDVLPRVLVALRTRWGRDQMERRIDIRPIWPTGHLI